MSCFCYLHIFPNSKIYVGTTQLKKPERRWGFEGRGYKKQPLIWNAICKYGWENINHKVIVCETPEKMWEMEKELIKKYDTTNHEKGYNLSIGGEKSGAGCHKTEETRRRMSELMKGKMTGDKNPSKRPEVRRKIGDSNKGKVRSEEVRKNLSEKNKGENNPNYGKHLSEDIRRKIGLSHKGVPRLKRKYITPNGEIREMQPYNVKKHHPDWTRIHYLDEAIRMKSNILISRGETRFQGIMDNIYYFTFDGLFTELRQSLTQQYPEYMFSIMKDGEEDFIQGIFTHYDSK